LSLVGSDTVPPDGHCIVSDDGERALASTVSVETNNHECTKTRRDQTADDADKRILPTDDTDPPPARSKEQEARSATRPPEENRRDSEAKRGKKLNNLDSTGLRGFAAESRRDVDLSNIELLSMSTSRLPSILRMGTGSIESVFPS